MISEFNLRKGSVWWNVENPIVVVHHELTISESAAGCD